jgi:hypothetical protein
MRALQAGQLRQNTESDESTAHPRRKRPLPIELLYRKTGSSTPADKYASAQEGQNRSVPARSCRFHL